MIRKYTAILAILCGISPLKAQNTNDEFWAIANGAAEYLATGQGSWIPNRPGYFESGCFTYKNVSEGLTGMVRQLSEAIVWSRDKQAEGDLLIPRDIAVGLDRFRIIGFAEGAISGMAISSINLPPDIRTIPRRCFNSCYNLDSVRFHGETVFIEDAAFGQCHSLKRIKLPSSVKMIGDFCFEQSGLEYFIVPKSVEYLGQRAFQNCKKLKSVRFTGHRISSLQGYMFAGCESLEEVILPHALDAICSHAFENTGLKQLTLPSSLTKIYSYAFNGNQLQRLDILAKTPPQTGKLFTASDFERITLHVPKGALATYRADPLWSKFKSIIEDL